MYKANYGEETNTMCIKKSVFKELLADNPDCQKFYEKRAKERRREFRRLMKTEMRKRNIIKKTMTENEMDEEILRTPQLRFRTRSTSCTRDCPDQSASRCPSTCGRSLRAVRSRRPRYPCRR